MKNKYLPFKTRMKTEYDNLHMLFAVDGGAYFFATRNEKFYVISDFGTLADFFVNDEKELAKLKSEYEFDTKEECRTFVEELILKSKKELSNIKLPTVLLS